jgi:hypothetical protein
MTRIAIWCHYPSTSRSAAGQRVNSFIERLRARGDDVFRLGGGFLSSASVAARFIKDMQSVISKRVQLHLVSVPPYRSVLPHICLLLALPGSLIVDQRDLALSSASKWERLAEKLLIRRAGALVVTTHAQRRRMARRHKILPPIIVIRNGTSDDLADIPVAAGIKETNQNSKIRVVYQGLIGGKRLTAVVVPLSVLGCDLDLVTFVDRYSESEIEVIRKRWSGPGELNIHADLDAVALARIIDGAQLAVNPIPADMSYAFTVKTADYACRGIPQLVIGSRQSVSRRVVEYCHLGHGIDSVEQIDRNAIDQALRKFRRRRPEELKAFRRSTHSSRIVDLVNNLVHTQ